METKFKMAAPKVTVITTINCLLDEIENSFLLHFQDLYYSLHQYLNHQKTRFHWHLIQEMQLKIKQQSVSDLKWLPYCLPPFLVGGYCIKICFPLAHQF